VQRLKSLRVAPRAEGVGVVPGRENGFHQLRHHFASVALRDGVDIRQLAEYLGHSDPAFTLRVYCHLMPGTRTGSGRLSTGAFSEAPDCPGIAQGGETGR
jgi:integrase